MKKYLVFLNLVLTLFILFPDYASGEIKLPLLISEGERLALGAQRIAYGDKDVVCSGPLVSSATRDNGKIIIEFNNTGSGMIAKGGGELSQFAVAGRDKKFVWADAVIDDNTVIVASSEVPEPVYVRYAWADNPEGANLYNKEGLPASPFEVSVK